MATITTSTASIDAELNYVCSKCGAPNTALVKIQAYAKSPGKASLRIQSIMAQLALTDPARRYTHANLRCRCSKCRHSEPWTKLDFYKLDGHILAWSIVCGLMFLTQGLAPIKRHFEFPQSYPLGSALLVSLIWLVIMLLPPVLIFLYKMIRGAVCAKKIRALPPQCLPVIRVLPNTPSRQGDIMARVNEKMNNR